MKRVSPAALVRPVAAAAMLGAGALFGLLYTATAAHADTVYNPPIHQAQGIEYMSGGIGSDEAKLMRAVEPRWPASFEFAVQDGRQADFAASVRLSVRDMQTGALVLDQVDAAGPFMVARLEPGRYEVEATLAGTTLRQALSVEAGRSTHASFMWPAGTDMAAARAQPAS